MSGRDRMVEHQIQKAQATGGMSGLKGEGKPLPERAVLTGTDDTTAIGMRIMAEAGVLPEEIRLQKELEALRRQLANLTDPAQQKPLMKQIADLDMRRAIAQEARHRFMR